jgi:cobaltochelatase CobN
MSPTASRAGPQGARAIVVVTNADTEVLGLRVAAEALPKGFPPLEVVHAAHTHRPPSLEHAGVVVVRLLGGRRAWEAPFDELCAAASRRGVPLVALGGEAVADPELEARSSAPPAIVRRAFEYFVAGGPRNLEQLLRGVSDALLGTSFGAEPPQAVPQAGVLFVREPGRMRQRTKKAGERGGQRPSRVAAAPGRVPVVGLVVYRAHVVAGNTTFVEGLAEALAQAGARTVAVFAYSLRDASSEHAVLRALERAGVDVVVTTTFAAGALDATGEAWDPGGLGTLEVPVLQAVSATTSEARWQASPEGLSPLDVATAVALPELDGRIVTVPVSFKEVVDDGEGIGAPVVAYRVHAERARRVAELAVSHARLRRLAPRRRRVAVVLSAYPTRRSRIGNAVGLDTPASLLALMERLEREGMRVGPRPSDPDELMAMLADGLPYDAAEPDQAELERQAKRALRYPAGRYEAWFSELPEELKAAVCGAWGEPPGRVRVLEPPASGGEAAFVFGGTCFGDVLVAVQPPRGFGDDPIAIYHSPDLPPPHHYLAFYRMLADGFGADAIVHLGKHGTLEWLPGKGVGLSAACVPDAALGALPLVYPFVVNDPGEGVQAKRRAHAVIVDHLVPPLRRAGLYGELERLERLLDEHTKVAQLDPDKLPLLRRAIWECLLEAELHRDLGLGEEPPSFDEAFEHVVGSVDAYLCELKDATIRGGLHVLGRPPSPEEELGFALACTRLPQGGVPALRDSVARVLGVDLERADRRALERVERWCRRLLRALAAQGWEVPKPAGRGLGARLLEDAAVVAGLAWVCGRLVPALKATTRELDAIARALAGGFVEPGPAGAPSRGQAHVLPTGRNFYGVDPRAVPSRAAWETGRLLAEELVRRHVADTGRPPRSVGIVAWGTAAMRTSGDDVAEALALMGVRPRFDAETDRVVGLEPIPLLELGRPRVDVVVRVSGLFRDAFPHVIELLDEARRLVASLEEGPEKNPIRFDRPDDPRVFGPPPGAYGSGIYELIESGHWNGPEDLAAVWLAWTSHAYGRGGAEAAPDALRRRLARVEVALKNQDNREHDVFDSDDYFQDHGGMVATVRVVAGRAPRAYFGDSSDPARPRVRTLAEEAARVVRSRVLNPRWIDAMRRHGYKGAFEMAATVDYLFGYDATAQVVEDWMYERVADAYLGDPKVRAFLARSNPWAMRAIAERILEAEARGLFEPSERTRKLLEGALLEAEGLEERRAARGMLEADGLEERHPDASQR